jgi:hypothetical protein
MRLLTSLAGGLGGAVTLTLLQELLKRVDPGAPRVDLLGKQAAAKLFKKAGRPLVSGKKLHATSLAGDLVLNTLYYSLTGVKAQRAASAGGLLGIGMGVATVMLPKMMQLNTSYVAGSAKRKYMTIGMYLLGGLVAAGVVRLLDGVETRKKKRQVLPIFHKNGKMRDEVLDITV